MSNLGPTFVKYGSSGVDEVFDEFFFFLNVSSLSKNDVEKLFSANFLPTAFEMDRHIFCGVAKSICPAFDVATLTLTDDPVEKIEHFFA